MADVKISYSQLKNTIDCYQQNIDTLQNSLSNINKKMDNLKAMWEGDAKVAFFDNLYVAFSKSMETDIEHLRFLKKQLEEVQTAFESVEQKYKTINI